MHLYDVINEFNMDVIRIHIVYGKSWKPILA